MSPPTFPQTPPRTARRQALVWLAAAGIAACQHGPRRDPPAVPATWHGPATTGALRIADDGRWWQGFDDAMLARAITAALQRNGDLAAAAWRLRTAQLRAGAATRALFPQPNGSLGAGASHAPALPGQPAPGWQSTVSGGLGVSWELDLWGRLRDQRTVALWEAQASDDDRAALALALSGNVARQYWQIAALQARLQRADASIDTARHTLQLTGVQYRAGAISGLDLAQAEQSLQQQQAARQQVQQQLDEARNGFSLLFDLPPPEIPDGLVIDAAQALAARIPAIPAGTPADLLMRRPDLRAAQRRLEATLLNVRITRKQFLPGVSLTGNLGTGGRRLADLLAAPSRSLGIGLSLPFLDVPELLRAPRIARNEYEAAVLGYRQSVLRALQEVENALAALDTQRRLVATQEAALARARRIERMSEVRYRAGAVALRFWLDAQESLRQTELALLDARLNALQAAAQLHLALGGDIAMPPQPAK